MPRGRDKRKKKRGDSGKTQKSKGNGQFWSIQNVGGNERNTQTNNVADNGTQKMFKIKGFL